MIGSRQSLMATTGFSIVTGVLGTEGKRDISIMTATECTRLCMQTWITVGLIIAIHSGIV